jgi:predicted nucleic acid-binding protein
VLDILDDQRPFSSGALQLWQLIESGDPSAFISESIVTTTDYILQKTLAKSARLSLLSELLGFLQLLPCNTLTCQKAIKSSFPDLEDALLYQLAMENDLDYFITSDTRALKKLAVPNLPVVSAREFLKIIP